jgi:uncharacterized protein YgiB involved in biofilm formation
MKRSKSIGLITMGVSIIALTACDEPKVDALVFDNLQQCLADKDLSREQCESNYAAAKSQHADVAPKYASREACEAEFGAEKCEAAPQRAEGGGSIFMPLMMGYMMGSMMSRGSVAPQPLYRSAGDSKTYRTADNQKVGTTTGRTQIAQAAARAPAMKTSTMSRGGFGSSARTVGTAGG